MKSEEPPKPPEETPQEAIKKIIENENLSDEQVEDAIAQYLRNMNPKTPDELTQFSMINTV